MADRKSSRCRKVIDYAKFASDDLSDNDDFAAPTPTSRNSMGIKSKEKKQEKTAIAQDSKIQRPKKERKPLDDKLYERELQLALEISAKDVGFSPISLTSESAKKISYSEDSDHSGCQELIIEAEISPPTLTREVTIIAEKENIDSVPPILKCPGISTADTDVIEVLETDIISPAGRRQRRASEKALKNLKEDSPEKPRGKKRPKDDNWDASDCESAVSSSDEDSFENDDDDDSDFSDSNVKSKSKPKASNKTQKKLPMKSKSPVKKKAKRPVLTPKTTTNKKSFTSPMPSCNTKSVQLLHSTPVMPKYSKPASSPGLSGNTSPLGGVSIKSPFSGGIRIGLSKKARVKPLHSSVQVPH